MKKWVLDNGIRLIYAEKDTDSVAIQVLVDVGSDDETPKLRGISHFIEHMVFEGTIKRPNAQLITNEIESLGGSINAYTTNTRTCFHIKVLRRHFEIALSLLADILQNPLFNPEDVKKQKKVIFKEIDMVTDEPRFHQWILLQQTLFKEQKCRFPVYGSKETVGSITNENLNVFFSKYYNNSNIIISIVGKIGNIKSAIECIFRHNTGTRQCRANFIEPIQKKNRITIEKRNTANSYVVVGHRTVPRSHEDSYVLDIIEAIIGRGQSGWMFDEIRNKRGLAYDVGVEHNAEKEFGYIATFASTDKKNIKQSVNIILSQLLKLKNVSPSELIHAKNYIEGKYRLDNEDTEQYADELCFWEQIGDGRLSKRYVNKINHVTAKEVAKACHKYFSGPYSLAIIEGKPSDR